MSTPDWSIYDARDRIAKLEREVAILKDYISELHAPDTDWVKAYVKQEFDKQAMQQTTNTLVDLKPIVDSIHALRRQIEQLTGDHR